MDESTKEKVNKILEILKKALKSGSYVTNPKTKPRRVMKIEEYVLPSRIKKKYRTLASRLAKYRDPRLFPILEEYKQLLYRMIEQDPRYRARRLLQREADLIAYGHRKPTKLERKLIGDRVLPSKLISRPVSANVDIALYRIEHKEDLGIEKYTLKVTHGEATIDTIIARLRENLTTALVRELERLNKPYGFYVYINTKCMFEKNEELIPFYIGSLTHNILLITKYKGMKEEYKDMFYNRLTYSHEAITHQARY